MRSPYQHGNCGGVLTSNHASRLELEAVDESLLPAKWVFPWGAVFKLLLDLWWHTDVIPCKKKVANSLLGGVC